MKIDPSQKEKILQAVEIDKVIGEFYNLKKSGAQLICECPMCGKSGKGKGLQINPSKGIYKCFSCDFGGNNPIKFLQETQKMDFPEAMKWLSDFTNIPLQETPVPKQKKRVITYRDKQLKASGLTLKDVKAIVPEDSKTTKEVDVFQPGTRDQYGNLMPGDDMIIWYYDLEGNHVQYKPKRGNKLKNLFRIRYQNPDAHLDKNGRPVKYASPSGSGTHLYIPQTLRKLYQEGRQFKRLFLQEGEKKAEKACKHGLPSVGLMGIHNLARNGQLPHEIQLIVQRCGVKEVIFILDSDWLDLNQNLDPTKPVDMRPRSFANAIISFKEYMDTFKNLGIFLECYFGAILENENNDKGLDDLLTNTLKKNENDLKDDIEYSINNIKESDGEGEYIKITRVSGIPTAKIFSLWHLDSPEVFAEFHKERLQELPEFIIRGNRWRFNQNGRIELAQPLLDDEQYWEKEEFYNERSNHTKVNFKFRYLYCYNFLRNRGYGRIMMADMSFKFCKVVGKTVELVDSYQIKDFVFNFTKDVVEKRDMVDVMDMLYRGGKMYLGPDSLSNIDFVWPKFELADKNYQNLYFKNKIWKISADGIKEMDYNVLENYVWKDKIRDLEVQQIPELLNVYPITEEYLKSINADDEAYETQLGRFAVEFSESAKKSHFMQFIWNTGEFYWDKFLGLPKEGGKHFQKEDVRTDEERIETTQHFVSKMSAFGFLLHQFFDKSKSKAVIGMDGKLSEVGSSNGGSGKSIFGDAIGQVVSQVSIGGKNKKLTDDPFIFEEVTEKTDNVFFDDVRANMDFEFLFPFITAKFMVNVKGEKKFTIPDFQTPKIYISTNHAINGEGSSFKRRQFYIAFSDFYNHLHVPVDDFGINFFDEWDQEQWNLFYNFMAKCLQVYLKHGLVSPPMERLELRRMRQTIGEAFITWADLYFNYDEINKTFGEKTTNIKIIRGDLYASFVSELTSKQKGFETTTQFKKKFKLYCEFRGAVFNPHKKDKEGNPGADDKTGGVEYFTLADSKFNEDNLNRIIK